MKMLRRDARSIAESVDTSGAPNIRYFPSGAMIALKEKQVKITQVYIRADITMLGSISHTASIRGPVDNPKDQRINNKIQNWSVNYLSTRM